jgi:hypothetical protein
MAGENINWRNEDIMKDNVTVSRELLKKMKEFINVNTTKNDVPAFVDELDKVLWDSIETLDQVHMGASDVIELRSLDGKTTSLAIVVSIPGEYRADCLALLKTEDGSPCFVPTDQYSGWRFYVLNDNNG